MDGKNFKPLRKNSKENHSPAVLCSHASNEAESMCSDSSDDTLRNGSPFLPKLNVVRHIEVDVSMDELDVTAAESKATYNEIREYVWEHHQLKVSNLYIAQVKQKCGIIERENYHKAKNENAKQPKCPKEKEDAIVEALKHFKMI